MITAVVDPKKYAKLLIDVLPQPITSDEQHRRLLSVTSRLLDKARTPEETALLRLLTVLAEEYELRRYADLSVSMTPVERLRYLMEENGLAQNAFAPGVPQSRISEILAGKRNISKAQAKILAHRFKVNPTYFLY